MTKRATYECHLHEHEPRWFAVYTRYNREKLIQRRLAEKGIEAYLPLQKFTRRYTRKVRQVEIPLINCYLFTRINRKHYIPVLETPDVMGFVNFSRNLISIPEQEIQTLKRIVGEAGQVELGRQGYHIGDEVEVAAGNLTGIKGILLSQDKRNNFLVELSHIGYALQIEVDPALLRKTGKQWN